MIAQLFRIVVSALLVCVGLGSAQASQRLIAVPGVGTLPAPGSTYSSTDGSHSSMLTFRFRGIERQSHDVSCGAAALATLAKHYFGMDVSEKSVIDGILESKSPEERAKIEGAGFSMLELKGYGERLGLIGGGFRVTEVDKLRSLKVPAITLVNSRGYNHFVVLRGIDDGIAHVADPAFGNKAVALEEFGASWNGVVLVFISSDLKGDESFRKAQILSVRNSDVMLVERFRDPLGRQPGEF